MFMRSLGFIGEHLVMKDILMKLTFLKVGVVLFINTSEAKNKVYNTIDSLQTKQNQHNTKKNSISAQLSENALRLRSYQG